MKHNAIYIITVCLFALNSCQHKRLCDEDVINRKPSPNNTVDAVVITKDCGATTDVAYYVYISQQGKKDFNHPVFVADKVHNINIHWKSSNTLIISYDRARIFKYKTFVKPGIQIHQRGLRLTPSRSISPHIRGERNRKQSSTILSAYVKEQELPMPRKPRIEMVGYYHIVNRGVDRF